MRSILISIISWSLNVTLDWLMSYANNWQRKKCWCPAILPVCPYSRTFWMEMSLTQRRAGHRLALDADIQKSWQEIPHQMSLWKRLKKKRECLENTPNSVACQHLQVLKRNSAFKIKVYGVYMVEYINATPYWKFLEWINYWRHEVLSRLIFPRYDLGKTLCVWNINCFFLWHIESLHCDAGPKYYAEDTKERPRPNHMLTLNQAVLFTYLPMLSDLRNLKKYNIYNSLVYDLTLGLVPSLSCCGWLSYHYASVVDLSIWTPIQSWQFVVLKRWMRSMGFVLYFLFSSDFQFMVSHILIVLGSRRQYTPVALQVSKLCL